MRRTLLAVTGLLGLVKMMSASAEITEVTVPPLDAQSVSATLWPSHQDVNNDYAFYVQGQFKFALEPGQQLTKDLTLLETPDALDQAPAVRLASISLTATFSR